MFSMISATAKKKKKKKKKKKNAEAIKFLGILKKYASNASKNKIYFCSKKKINVLVN